MSFEGNPENAEKHLKTNYNNIKSPVSFLSPYKIYQFYNGNLPLKKIKKFLSTSESYTLLKPDKKPSVHTSTLSYYPGDVVQADLFFVDRISEFNDNVKYILSCICVHSRFAYLEPMKTKSAQETKEKLSLIFQRMPTKPNICVFDQGSEFKNIIIAKFLKHLGIKHYFALGEYKCSTVEAFQKSIQRKIYSYMVSRESLRFIDALQDLVSAYNNTVHSSISPLTPEEAQNPKNVHILENIRSNRKNFRRIKKIPPLFKENDRVRISLKKGKYSRSYDIQNTYEEFIVHKVLLHRLTPFYILKDLKNRILSGKFTQNQLQSVSLDIHRGTVIKERMKGRKKEFLMKFKGYDDSFNEWIPEKNIKKINE